MSNDRSYTLPVFATIVLHAALLVVLGGSWSINRDERVVVKPVKVVQASLVQLKKPKPVVKPKPKPVAKPKIVQKPKVEPKKSPVVKKPEPEKPKKVEEKPPEIDQEEMKKQQQEQALAAMADDEDDVLQADEDASLIAQYTAMISQQMHQKWKLPPSARRNMVALVSIRMVPTGDLVSVTIAQSSGNQAFDQSAILAVEKAGRFAFMKNLPSRLFESHFREFTFRFSPEDLRL